MIQWNSGGKVALMIFFFFKHTEDLHQYEAVISFFKHQHCFGAV